MFSYLLVVVAAATGATPATVSSVEFRDLRGCETAKQFVLANAPDKVRDWKNQYVTATCVLSTNVQER